MARPKPNIVVKCPFCGCESHYYPGDEDIIERNAQGRPICIDCEREAMEVGGVSPKHEVWISMGGGHYYISNAGRFKKVTDDGGVKYIEPRKYSRGIENIYAVIPGVEQTTHSPSALKKRYFGVSNNIRG